MPPTVTVRASGPDLLATVANGPGGWNDMVAVFPYQHYDWPAKATQDLGGATAKELQFTGLPPGQYDVFFFFDGQSQRLLSSPQGVTIPGVVPAPAPEPVPGPVPPPITDLAARITALEIHVAALEDKAAQIKAAL